MSLVAGQRTGTMAAGVALIAAVAVATPAYAGYYDTLPEEARRNIQDYLVWTGYYDAPIDGAIGPQTVSAIQAWQTENGHAADGILAVLEAEAMGEAAREAYSRAQFTVGTDGDAGLSYGLPYALVSVDGENEWNGLNFADDEKRLRVSSFRMDDMTAEKVELFASTVFDDVPGFESAVVRFENGNLTVRGGDHTEIMRMDAKLFGDQLRGIFVWMDRDLIKENRHLLAAMTNSLELAPVETAPLFAANAGENEGMRAISLPNAPSDGEFPSGSGTGFVVDADGSILTNAHVVAGCGRIEVSGVGDAAVMIADESLDLALLRVDGARELKHATIAMDDPMLGEDVFAFGYPLPQALGSEIGFSRGSVSSMVGLRAEPTQFRMTASVQPGNSGGPLVDEEGRVIGMVTAKLDAMAVANATGDIPQSMNFAIRSSVLRDWLVSKNISFDAAERRDDYKRASAVAKDASSYTHQIVCYEE
ncbi:trypsin-like peptidase domain-containing protein [Notoacmeibacter sp. MSK16QG-6]|uniref:trypsin-like peptidase domain-containing protein n=1 Tax=Notoacmeibacter sp. MSK16QG-6 TaxID=2957982 RepID=UPI00209FC15B|nr:trypsin-like peptidase domain-containing protein [Notoacmeibacter sp. MSK16QG-6]MCP1200333.1 trypsin-like peptidase domain-containing protein [Notoacmeibacter sp. MSK16QG-6]